MKERTINVGDWVIIKSERILANWYTEKPLKVIDVGEQILSVDYNLYLNTHIKDKYTNKILIEDVEYYPMREKKLERILYETD